MLVCNVNIYHSQLIRSIGINCLIASCLYSCLENSLLTSNDWLSLQIHSDWSKEGLDESV